MITICTYMRVSISIVCAPKLTWPYLPSILGLTYNLSRCNYEFEWMDISHEFRCDSRDFHCIIICMFCKRNLRIICVYIYIHICMYDKKVVSKVKEKSKVETINCNYIIHDLLSWSFSLINLYSPLCTKMCTSLCDKCSCYVTFDVINENFYNTCLRLRFPNLYTINFAYMVPSHIPISNLFDNVCKCSSKIQVIHQSLELPCMFFIQMTSPNFIWQKQIWKCAHRGLC